MLSSFLVAAAFAAGVFSSPLNIPHTVHEKRDAPPYGWSRASKLNDNVVLPMKIGLTQSNLDQGAVWLDEVSHPDSPKYGQHWTAAEVAKAFAPSKQTVDAVRDWLETAGISADRVKHSQSLGFLQFDATVAEAESLLKTEYNLYEHQTGKPHVACEEYSIPSHLHEYVDFISPTVHFDAQVNSSDRDSDEESSSLSKRQVLSQLDQNPGAPNSPSLPKLGRILASKAQIITDLSQCDQQTIPACLRSLYDIPEKAPSHPNNSFGVVEFTPQAYKGGDLDMFFKNFSTSQIGNRPIFDSIDGGISQMNYSGFYYNGEADLDLEYSMTLTYPQNVTLYQAGDMVQGASFNNFLDAIDGSYCTYKGGDNPNYDGIYPDDAPGGYTGPENCGGFAATNVISISYNYNEHDLGGVYARRQCHEYMKLGMMGVSMFFSSGDSGVEGNGNTCINGTGKNAPYIPGNEGGRFNPSFPGSCPYVTAVGGTQVIPGTELPSTTQPEMACMTKILSGGGFTVGNLFALPKYQKSAVQSYYKKYNPPYNASVYNNSQTVRGIPDVAANGFNYLIAFNGQFGLVAGTSASTPTFASVITLINAKRLAKGKSPVGFINPVAYANPQVFNDVTTGNNTGCKTNGFSAVPGWDPVTGLGTPNYPKMLKLWMSLP